MENHRIAFIGAGNMADSLIRGLLARGVAPGNILACDPDTDKLHALRDECGIVPCEMAEAAEQADVIVLAVKPQVMAGVCRQLAASLPAADASDAVFVSIAAGIPLSALEQWLGSQRAIVRTMPNTPSLVGEGATALIANDTTGQVQRELATQLMQAVGITAWVVQEDDIDIITALSGSGPAYCFLMMEAMTAAATDMGLDEETARRFAIQTALGAGRLAASGDTPPDELRRRVTSPGGTTEQALRSFSDDHFASVVKRAMQAARQRSAELADQAD
ncbi:MAG: pyrroline-5-carboxylate reductase [Pseudomonadota bacterium]